MKRIALALVLITAACAQQRDSRVLLLSTGWQYVLTPPDARPDERTRWVGDASPQPGHDLWVRVRLPMRLPPDAHLVFRAYAGRLEILVGGQNIYRFDEPTARGHLRTHDVSLGPSAAGNWLTIRFPSGEEILIGGEPVIAPANAVPATIVALTTAPFRDQIGRDVVGSVLIIVGLACIALSRVRLRGNAAALLWFGFFALLYGLRMMTASGLPALLGMSLITAQYASAFITYVIPVPGWQMARALLGDGWKRSLRWQVVAFAVLAPIGIVSDIVQRRPATLWMANSALVVIGGINLILNLIPLARTGLREAWVLLVGSSVFMLYALNRNLAALHVLPWREQDETFGFVVFVAALGYAAMRAFVRGERQRLSMEGELSAAREIQRSILPANMPALPGLRFDVRYDPASSVAGDLYDFVAADDARAGLLVADVAGHGVPAALIASMVKIAVSSQSHLAHDPAAMLTALNETLRRDVRRALVTATYLYFDTAQQCVAVANAGHPSPLLFRHSAVRELAPAGVFLGRFGTVRYEAQQTALAAGDRIVAWTDGIVEARDARGEPFGDDRLRAMIQNGDSADAVVAAVLRWRARSDADDADDRHRGCRRSSQDQQVIGCVSRGATRMQNAECRMQN
jgi:sigma-B regulation protein RsbU (phosphoserine phosphatase)